MQFFLISGNCMLFMSGQACRSYRNQETACFISSGRHAEVTEFKKLHALYVRAGMQKLQNSRNCMLCMSGQACRSYRNQETACLISSGRHAEVTEFKNLHAHVSSKRIKIWANPE